MPFFTRGLKPERVEPPPSMFKYQLEGDSISGNSYYDPYSVTMDNMSVFSAASSVVNPQSVRGIVHRGMFGGKPHDNTNIFDANPFNSVNTNSAGGGSGGGGGDGGGSVGGPAAGQAAGGLGTAPSGPGGVVPGTIQGALPQFHFNSALNPAEYGALPNS
ncbi:unnamed protein product, partial [Ectocarpus sp. 13 AM-2016]